MKITKKFDRAFQWAGEKMGSEARTTHSDEFKLLETEMDLRQDGMDRLQKASNAYMKWITRRCDAFEDKERATPAAYLGRVLAGHGDDFELDSEFGTCLASLGQANERLAAHQEAYAENTTATWLDQIDRTVTSMKEYQTARKKLESRRLAFDASTARMQKAKRDDFRIEEEVRLNRAKFEESSEDVLRRMQDIKEAEVDNITALTSLLDAQLDFHERCTEELRRVRQSWAAVNGPAPSPYRGGQPKVRSRSNTARSWQEPRQRALFEEPEPPPPMPPRRGPPSESGSSRPPPPAPPRPNMARAVTSDGRGISRSSVRVSMAPLARVATDTGAYGQRGAEDVFADDASTASGSKSPDWGERSASPATSYGSLSRSASMLGMTRKAPPPPPVNRARKPPPPIPARKENLGY